MTKLDRRLEEMVKERFSSIETLEERKSDSLDFHEVSVWGLKDVLLKAYEMGKEDALKKEGK